MSLNPTACSIPVVYFNWGASRVCGEELSLNRPDSNSSLAKSQRAEHFGESIKSDDFARELGMTCGADSTAKKIVPSPVKLIINK